MEKDRRSQDWFSVEYKFTVNNAEELFRYIEAASYILLDEADVDYERSLVEQPDLAVNMLAEIGVSCAKTS